MGREWWSVLWWVLVGDAGVVTILASVWRVLWWVFVGYTVGVEDVKDSVLVGYSDFIKKMYFLKSVMIKLLLILASIL